MRAVVTRFLGVSAVLLSVMIAASAQERPAPQAPNDPRVGLKPGFSDAGQAARNMRLVATLPKPEGFFDPKSPAGEPTPPESTGRGGRGGAPTPEGAPPAAAGAAQPPSGTPPAEGTPQPPGRGAPPGGGGGGGLNFANSDLAFSGTHMFIGNFSGFNTYDIENARKPQRIASVVCPGGQGDVSIYGNLLFMSVEQTRGRIDCGTQGVQAPVSAERFRGVRIFDITDLNKPKQVAAVQTCRGSHTHTLVTDPKDKANIYVYGSGTGGVRSGEELTGCSGLDPKEDPNTALYSIDVIKVPLASPEIAEIVNRPRIFADLNTGNIAALLSAGDERAAARPTTQCHDITVFPEIGLAAGACAGNGLLLDISDPVHPVRLDFASDKNFAYWHSATFNNDGTKVIFTDEWGGGTRPRCRATDPPTWGADAVFDIVDKKLRFGGYFKIPAPQTEQENCVAHNGSIVPVPGRDIMVQAWYQGGVSVFDFSDSAHPFEVAYFDRGPISAKDLYTGGYWSAYWYNGHIYGSEIARGIDIFELTPSDYLTKNEIDAATLVRYTEFNAQEQPRVTWPANFIVARAYLDQLTRSKAIAPARATALKTALDRAEGDHPSRAAIDQLDTLANDLEKDAAAARDRDADRLRSLAATIKGRTAKLRG